MSDTFESYTYSLRDPVVSATEITPNDATDLTQTSRALFVGGAGDLRVTLLDGSDVTFRNLHHVTPADVYFGRDKAILR
ncbi:spike base protein, RCAP_Rcc01079 family [Cognatiyoonia sp.]|uniref:spike base protein, RCAP_Rcc01079 family n=1 Tax=Cognatiyoonia sp. TaxID=2211652 RepID=UPI003F69589F